jgi:hypothetical protein
MATYPFTISEPEKWNIILQRHNMKQTTWKKMLLEYQHWYPDFNPDMLTYVDDVEFCEKAILSTTLKREQ